MAKSTLVTLACKAAGVQPREFGIEHAENLLRMPNNGGWYIPNESQFKYENGNISRKNKKGDN